VSKKFHLASTWLTAIGANLSALWILVANSWMQYPVGMHFNPDTARNEMTDFWAVLFSPVAINKFLHTVSRGYVVATVFVIGISCWYLIKETRDKICQNEHYGRVSFWTGRIYIYVLSQGTSQPD